MATTSPDDFPALNASSTANTPSTSKPPAASITPAAATIPATINIFVDKDNRNVLVARVDRNLIIKHSKTVKKLLEDTPTRQDVVITAAAKGPVEHVIEFMKYGKQPLRIGVGSEPFTKAIAILQAVNALDVEPPQPQIENHIMYTITQLMMNAEQVFVIQEASGRLGKEGRIYKAMVQAVAYNVLHDGFTAKELASIKNVAGKYPDLHKAVQDKIDELKQRQAEHERRLEDKDARKVAHEKRVAKGEAYNYRY